MNCPCHSGQSYELCCGRFITHRELPENASLLMRSRYAAFALGERNYLLASWHPDYRPQQLTLDADIRWIGLEILSAEQSAERATVVFEASLLVRGQVSAMRERSDFVFEQGRWLYTRGEQLTASFKPFRPGRNEACPCGSGAKFKRCCGR